MKKAFKVAAFGGIGLAFLSIPWGGIAQADTFNLFGVDYPTLSAQVDFTYTSGTGTINIDITNSSDLTSSLTAFAFNVPAEVTGFSSFSGPAGWGGIFDLDAINTPGQFGFYDAAGITGPNFNGGSVSSGIAINDLASFSFVLAGTGLDTLTEASFLDLLSAPGNGNPDPQYFIARFQGVGTEDGSDVAIPGDGPPPPVPEPATMVLLGAGLVGMARLRNKRK